MNRPLRILHLEDNPRDTELVQSILEADALACEVVRVESRDAFIAALERDRFDLILSDFSLPSFDGLAALDFLKSKDLDIPFIVVSGTIGEESAVLMLQRGATDYLLKQRLTRLPSAMRRALREAEHTAERKRVEQALRESEARLRHIAENAEDIFWMYDLDLAKLLYISPAYEKIWGRSCQSLYAAPLSFLEIIHPDDRERVTRLVHQQKATGQLDEEYRIVRPDGAIRWIWDRGFPIRDDAGHPCQLARFGRDITDRKLLEEQFRQAQKMEAVGQLAGGIAHDFNNLLTVINGYAVLLLKKLKEDDPQRRKLDQIRQAGEGAAALTNQLLAFSRRQVLAPAVLDLNVIVAKMEEMLHRLIGENITLSARLAPRAVRVKADPGQVEQILMNLAVNARDAMPNGGQLILETANVDLDESHHRTHGAQPGPYVMLAVSDTGCGMDQDTQARIFEPFFTTKEEGKGTGLGLSTVYGIVKQNDGSIVVESEIGRGTAFKIYLPRLVAEAGDAAVTSADVDSCRGTETILLVENQRMIRTQAAMILRSHGYTALETEHPDEALTVVERHSGPIHLLMTDVVMPGLSGRDLAERLRTRCPAMKVLFLSSYAEDVVVGHGVLQRQTPYLQKPFTPRVLARKVRDVLDKPLA